MAGEQEMICFHPPVESGGQSRGQEVGTSSKTLLSVALLSPVYTRSKLPGEWDSSRTQM